ncbi:MAG: MBL fold metallo-hydrolase [Bacteroidales bacterium]|jgi:phosphoribosyl 1,2-cyclic phosphate phosphodiesterase|nr:MBL fold metallo-hydrolase [Bacteroidales bacterium]
MGNLKITFLGTGTSQGIPVIGCSCEVCSSNDIKDKRYRTSCLIQSDKTQITIDCGPDFRQQMLINNVRHLDAILVTHSHHDHIGGLDEVRSFNYIQQKAMPIYANRIALDEIKDTYYYAFENSNYPGLPQYELIDVEKDKPFFINELKITPIEVMHYKLPVLAYRIGDFAYITDAKTISQQEKAKLKGVKTLVVNALRREEHFAHFNLEEALNLIKEVSPQKAYLTHISHFLGLDKEVSKTLPSNVFLAYDGLEIFC